MNDIMAGLASQINEQHSRAVEHAGKAVEHARQCGELLIEAKAQLDHGEWLPWIAASCQFSERTSQAYMRVAKNWTAISKSAAVADLPLREALAHLAEPRPEAESDDPSDSWLGPDLEELVGRMLDGPFTDEDIADTAFFQTKFMRQLKLPAVVSACVLLSEDYGLPMLVCAPVDDVADTVNRLAPYAKGANPMEISFNVENMIRAAVLLQLTAQRLIGMLLREIEARFKRTEPEHCALVRSTAETLCARIEEVAQREGIDLGPAPEWTGEMPA